MVEVKVAKSSIMKLFFLLAVSLAAVKAEEADVLKDFSDRYTQFSADIYKELLKSESGNFLLCPLSLNVILALSSYGANAKTLNQLSAGLHLPEDKDKLKQIYKAVAPLLKSDSGVTLNSANKIYLKHKFQIEDDFKSTAVDVFKSDIENIDFEEKEQAANKINAWIGQETKDKIKNLIGKDDLNEDTRAILVNAMYFHGLWITKFKEEDTKKRTFHANGDAKVETDMMEVTEFFNYYDNPELKAQFLELPYQGGKASLNIVLPKDAAGLAAVEAGIADVIAGPEYRKQKVHVVLPKFKIESTIEFTKILKALGIEDAFEDFADFSALSKEPTKISKIIQKNFMEVEEKGTTAASATAVIQQLTRSRAPKELEPVQFIADHPFVYYLKGPAGIIFIGRCVRP